ncbi:MAG: hypothetical protein HY088_06745 [Ignavibacteriales bacterium]|nr:hypothetical protein [Ignavibacteriales bacterium]
MIRIIVEGDGDSRSIPILLQKSLGRQQDVKCIDLGGKSNIVRLKDGFEQTILRQKEFGFTQFRVLLDADVFFAPYGTIDQEISGMRLRAKNLIDNFNIDVRVLWAIKNYESWLIGGLGKGDEFCNLIKITKTVSGDTQSAPSDPKDWLQEHLKDERYNPEMQECFSENVNWTLARKRNKSLRDFLKNF